MYLYATLYNSPTAIQGVLPKNVWRVGSSVSYKSLSLCIVEASSLEHGRRGVWARDPACGVGWDLGMGFSGLPRVWICPQEVGNPDDLETRFWRPKQASKQATPLVLEAGRVRRRRPLEPLTKATTLQLDDLDETVTCSRLKPSLPSRI